MKPVRGNNSEKSDMDVYLEAASSLAFNTEGFAQRVRLSTKDGLRQDVATGAWYFWNGQYWQHAGMKAVLIGVICKHTRDLFKNTELPSYKEDGKKHDAGLKWLRTIDNNPGHSKGIQQKLSDYLDLKFSIEELDINPNLINAPNGIVDLKAMEVRPHNMDDYMFGISGIPLVVNPDLTNMSITKVKKHIKETCPETYAFLANMLKNKKLPKTTDDRVMHFIAIMADLLNGSTARHKFYFLHGKGGNGKGTFDRFMSKVLGEYYGTADTNTFLSTNDSGNALQDIPTLMGKRMVSIPEVPKRKKINAAMVKNWSGGDPIRYKRHYEAYGTMHPESYLFFSLNHTLHVDEYGPAMKRRLVYIPCRNKITDYADKVIPHYERTLLEKEGEAFGSILVRLSLSLTNGEIKEPRCVRDESLGFIKSDNPIEVFLADYCQVYPYVKDEQPNTNRAIPLQKLYGHYKANALKSGIAIRNIPSVEVFHETMEDIDWIPEVIPGLYNHRDYGQAIRGRRNIIPNFDMTEAGLAELEGTLTTGIPMYFSALNTEDGQ